MIFMEIKLMKISNHLETIYREMTCNADFSASKELTSVALFLSPHEINKINDRLVEFINALKKVLGVPELPHIVLVNKRIDSSEVSENLRIIVQERNGVCKQNISRCSHVISIEIADSEIKADNGNYSMRLVTNSRNVIIQIIEDVLLDIFVFNVAGLEDKYKKLSQKRAFSKLKVDFCKGHQIVSNVDQYVDYKNYCSFASFCRAEDGSLDIVGYVKMWDDFINELEKEIPHIDNKDVVKEILKQHKKGGQISERRLLAMLSEKPHGRYVLVRVDKKPTTYQAQRLKSLFPGVVKIGKFKIIKQYKRYSYLKFHDCISLYSFDL